jgi:large subunit ribosomal protein L3
LGEPITVSVFDKGQRVDVIGTSKGRGTAGVVKRHNMAIKRKTHGTHEATRHAGSIGAGSYPGRVLKGMKMAGRMGNRRVTSVNLEVVEIDADRSLLFIRGSVPGHLNAIVQVRATVRP